MAGRPRTPTEHAERRTQSESYLDWINRLWRHRQHVAWEQAHARPSDLGAWMCIHRYEGSWTDPGAPYWGGLQMDLGFQETYGAEFLRRYGTADHWPVAIQILVARRARDGYGRYGPRGYGPWPNTARMCGLLG